MPRDLPLGNGNLLVNFDATFSLRDLYFPYVGQENHTVGGTCRFGVWVENHFSWVHDPEWQRSMEYENDTLVTRVTLRNARLGLHLLCTDAVDPHTNLFVRRVDVTDFFDRLRHVRLFFHFDAHLWGHNVGDSVYFDPRRRAIVHYKGRRYVLLNAMTDDAVGLAAYATGTKGIYGAEGTWRDAEDGRLSGHAVAQGSIDSVGACHLTVQANATNEAYFWLAVGKSADDVHTLDALIRSASPDAIIRRTREYWRRWVQRGRLPVDHLPEDIRSLYQRSFLILRTQIDNRGAIVAANDGECLQFGRDTYSYVWPRDGALVADTLIRGGFSEPSRRFFEFCQESILEDGYLLHKYNPDGSLGSSWHPWVDRDGREELPIQEDETALVMWALWSHYTAFEDLEFVRPLYEALIRRPAEFLLRYRDQVTGLPLASHDLWEERRGVHTFTVASVWAGLRAAASFADLFGDIDLALRCDVAASQVRDGMRAYMRNPEGGFVRALHRSETGVLVQDTVVDASMAGCFLFGMFAPDDEDVVRTMHAIEEKLWCSRGIGGIARYEHDYYCRMTEDAPGNPWIICTLWLASWYTATAQQLDDLVKPLALLRWAVDRAERSGVLAEQFHPLTGAPLSVAPLTWSHASFISATQDYLEKWRELSARSRALDAPHRPAVERGPVPKDDVMPPEVARRMEEFLTAANGAAEMSVPVVETASSGEVEAAVGE